MNVRSESRLTVPNGESARDAALADVLDGYVRALERGEAPTLAQLAAAHPDLADVLPEYVESLQAVQAALGTLPEATPGAPAAPKELGDFELLAEIGRGGMGVVYEARQISLNRRVALKVLPFAAVLDERQISRFRTEAQAAAGLHHPHIVPVFAVGQQRGLHFYAMQYIEGQSVAQALAELKASPGETNAPYSPAAAVAETASIAGQATVNSLSAADAGSYFRTVAQLGCQAAEALQHAHDYGVIHRDVKPSNLLVDRSGKLWVTDFGLARVQSNASVTLSGDVVGTFRYMSPEQAQGRADLVDGRTDVYSLGATLYEMATLRPAHEGDEPQALLRWIASEEPTPPRRLNAAIPADLETIILHALGKSREDRYATAQELADDLRRFVEGRPTLARRPSLVDRAGKWIARRRGAALATAAALLVVTLVSLGSALWVSAAGRRTAAALEQAERNLNRAETHFRQARAVVDHFGGNLADRLAEFPGTESLRRSLLADTLGYYRQFLDTVGDDPQLAGEMAATHFKSAAIAERLGNLAAARDEYVTAIEAWKTRDSAAAKETEDGSLVLALAQLARIEGLLGNVDESQRLFAEAIMQQRGALRTQPRDAAATSLLAESLANRGLMLRRSAGASAGLEDMQEAASLFALACAWEPDNARYARDLAVAKNNLSEALRESSPGQAVAACREAQTILQRLAAAHPDQQRYWADLAMTENNLAALHSAAGDLEQALAGYSAAGESLERLVRRHPLAPSYRRELAIVSCNRGLCLARLERGEESQAAFAAAQEVLESLAADFPDQPVYQSSLAALWNNRGVAWQTLGEPDLAVEAFAKAVALQEALLKSGGGSGVAELLEKHMQNYAEALRAVGRIDEANEIAERLGVAAPRNAEPSATAISRTSLESKE